MTGIGFDYLTLDEIESALPFIDGYNLDAPRDFLVRFRAAGGDAAKLTPLDRVRRDAAVRKLVNAAPNDGWWEWNGCDTPSARHLRCILLAYSPQPLKLCDWLDSLD